MADTGVIDVFISHSRQDEEVARALVELLRASLRLGAHQIRCTSIDGYRLPGGANTEEQLRAELLSAPVFIGILSPASLTSTFVLFELGARWGTNRQFMPLLAQGIDTHDLRPPLSNVSALLLREVPQLHQLVRNVAEALTITPDPPDVYHRYIDEVRRLAATTPPGLLDGVQDVFSGQDRVAHIHVDVPRVSVAEGTTELERSEHFTATIRDLQVKESTTVRVRYDWQVHIVNRSSVARGFFGHISFLDLNGYEVARHDISPARPYRVPTAAEQTYLSFLYIAPEHARLIRTAELALLPIELAGRELPAEVTLEWRGIWPQ